MMPLRIVYKLIQIVILTLIILYFNTMVRGQAQGTLFPIGAVFDQNTDEVQHAFKFAMFQYTHDNRNHIEVQLFVDVINTADAYKLSRLICDQFSRGVIAMLGAVTPASFDTLHSYTNTFQLPFVTPWFPEKVIPPSSGLIDYAVSMRPDYHKAVIDTITYYGWKNVIYIYDSHDGLLRLQQLYQSLHPVNATFRISNVKRVTNASEVVAFLSAIERLDRWSNKYVVLDSSTQLAKDTLIAHVRHVQLGRRNYHYFLSGLVMDERWEKEVTEFGAINITGFRLIDITRKVVREFNDVWKRDPLSAKAALMYDSAQVLVDAIARLIRKKPEFVRATMRRNASINTTKVIDCNPSDKAIPYEHGDKISRMIKKTELNGLTGIVRFNEAGHRKNFTLQVMELNVDGDMVKIATWYDYKGLVPKVAKPPPVRAHRFDRNRTYIVATIEETPYLKVIPPADESTTKVAFKGFCADLTRMLTNKLEIKYEMRLVKDGKYGNDNPKIVGGWDGLIGEILRKEADLVIAPLTVTLERETVVDFSKPFLSFNPKPTFSGTDPWSVFYFLNPLSKEIWFSLLVSVLGVSLVLYLVSRFSPYEWKVISFSDSQSSEQEDAPPAPAPAVVNEFSFWNSIWFSLGSFLQQGSDRTPRSTSGRIVGTVWWFFTLIVISSYTANLSSYLTLTRITEPPSYYGKITACPEDTGDIIANEAPLEDEPGEDKGWFSRLIDQATTETPKPCEMLVSTNSGIKDFAVALPKHSALREGINLAILALKNEGKIQKLIRKWFTHDKCAESDHETNIQDSELTLSQVAGLFYLLMGGMGVALLVALVEFCRSGRREAARANITLGAALRAQARMVRRVERNTTPQPAGCPQHDDEPMEWNGATYSGYYSPTNQIQEETAQHASFTQV